MSKKRKKSRFTKTDVNAICELQRKVDAYESYILCLLASIQHKDNPDYRLGVLMKGTDLDEWVNEAWKGLKDIKSELKELREYKQAKEAEFSWAGKVTPICVGEYEVPCGCRAISYDDGIKVRVEKIEP